MLLRQARYQTVGSYYSRFIKSRRAGEKGKKSALLQPTVADQEARHSPPSMLPIIQPLLLPVFSPAPCLLSQEALHPL
ncbi:hypothetical protein BDQ94DRAFT_133899, partial [Aspergillus welwitschiae]